MYHWDAVRGYRAEARVVELASYRTVRGSWGVVSVGGRTKMMQISL